MIASTQYRQSIWLKVNEVHIFQCCVSLSCCWCLQIRKEPKEVQMERQQQAAEANRLQRKEQQEANDAKKRMKGKNKPSKKHKKKQVNIIEEKKGRIRQEAQQQQQPDANGSAAAELRKEAPEHVPSALQRFYKRA